MRAIGVSTPVVLRLRLFDEVRATLILVDDLDLFAPAEAAFRDFAVVRPAFPALLAALAVLRVLVIAALDLAAAFFFVDARECEAALRVDFRFVFPRAVDPLCLFGILFSLLLTL